MRVEAVVQELSREWPGVSYDLLARNCNHFCDAFCVKLDVQRVPCKSRLIFPLLSSHHSHAMVICEHRISFIGLVFFDFSDYSYLDKVCHCPLKLSCLEVTVWVNRFANAGDAAFEAVDNTMARV